jgi:hypothetical protein
MNSFDEAVIPLKSVFLSLSVIIGKLSSDTVFDASVYICPAASSESLNKEWFKADIPHIFSAGTL